MAVTNQYGTEYTQALITKPSSHLDTSTWGGRLRGAFVSHVQSGAGDATSDVTIWKVPPGTVRLILPMSFLYINWTTTSATIDIGWGAYTDLNGDAVAADPNGLVDGLSVDTVGVQAFEELALLAGLVTSGYTKVFSSRDGVDLKLTSQDVAIANADAVYGMLTYMQD